MQEKRMRDDLISRQATIDTLNVGAELLRCVLDDADIVGAERAKYEWGLGLIESNINDIEELQSAQPERKKGAWINEGRIIRCNKCKTGYAVVKGMKSALTYNFCPNCGADMR
jgi:hypothetical protein